jgi:uridine phosphorylase
MARLDSKAELLVTAARTARDQYNAIVTKSHESFFDAENKKKRGAEYVRAVEELERYAAGLTGALGFEVSWALLLTRGSKESYQAWRARVGL